MSVLHTLLVTAGIARNEEHWYPSQHRGTVGVKGQTVSHQGYQYIVLQYIYLACSSGSSFRVL